LRSPTDPIRLLGTVSETRLAYGTLAITLARLRKSEMSTRNTLLTDWVFLALLLFAGLGGFVLEAFDYGTVPFLTDYALTVHVVAVFELLILAPFAKFAHVIYWPFAI
jgi:hypothetical protein